MNFVARFVAGADHGRENSAADARPQVQHGEPRSGTPARGVSMQRIDRRDTSRVTPFVNNGEVMRAFAVGDPRRIGWFRYFFDEDRWEWSPEVEQMHGYEPGTVTPTTRLVLSHKHPDDYQQIADTLRLIRETRQAFRSRHRICDVDGKVHEVAVLGDELLADDGRVIGTYGFYVDLTPEEQARQDQMTADLRRISEQRSAIEQAKGMLMMVYNVDEAAAFELLKWRSQETNIKLRRLAEQITADFLGARHDGTMPPQSVYDNLFLTAHQRARDTPQ
jgi:PAS domain S-box-containing protein